MRTLSTSAGLFASAALLSLAPGLSPAAARAQAAQPAGQVVARVLGQGITLAQLDAHIPRIPGVSLSPSEPKMTPGQKLELRQHRLSSAIWQLLLGDYFRRNRVVATPAEINGFAKGILNKRTVRGPERRMAESMVRQWKFDRAVYRQYGGTVIFQQSNPLEPVGAYRKYLEEQERAGALEIIDPALKRSFWAYYTGEHEMVVEQADVNYDTPWWLRRGKK